MAITLCTQRSISEAFVRISRRHVAVDNDLSREGSASAQTQTAKTAKFSRSTYSISFTRPRRETRRIASVRNKIPLLLKRMAGSCH
jgi:hypothetical protein